MPKKFQVILPDWLSDYIELIAETYEINISEVLRLEISLGILASAHYLSPEYKPKKSLEDILKQPRETKPKDLDREQYHRDISEILFETRKAVEHRTENLKK